MRKRKKTQNARRLGHWKLFGLICLLLWLGSSEVQFHSMQITECVSAAGWSPGGPCPPCPTCTRVGGNCNRIFSEIPKRGRGLGHLSLLVERPLSVLFSKMDVCVLLRVRGHPYTKRDSPEVSRLSRRRKALRLDLPNATCRFAE